MLLDTNVLFGALHRNMILSLAEGGFFRPRWSSTTLEELERSLEGRIGAEKAKMQVARINRAFPEGVVKIAPQMLTGLTLPDQDDRHVLAAAIQSRAAQIVTDNLKHFPAASMPMSDIEVVSADHLLSHTISQAPTNAAACIRNMRLRLNKPELTAEDLILKMEGQGLAETAAELADYAPLL